MSTLPRITVSANRRFLQTKSGAPFFWLGDTAWELFHRLTLEEASMFLENRRRKGMNVIQAVALAEFDGLRTPNAYGEFALLDDDPTRPNEAYFRHVDAILDLAAAKGLYIGLLPTWGDKVTPMWGAGPAIFTPENAHFYGRWLGARYLNRSNLLWILGGDRPARQDDADYRPIWRAMAAGIDAGSGTPAFKSYHPWGGHSTSEELHDEGWLDMNMIQSGHGSGRSTPVWELIERDYALAPIKPTLDAEPNYEDHPISPWPTWNPATGYFRDHDVRQQSYRSVFAGGCGVTYGHHSVWQFCGERHAPINHADRAWQDALDRPGAGQMIHLRRLMESRPYFSRIPAQEILVDNPTERGSHMRATRDDAGRCAFVYTPLVQPITVRLDWVANFPLRAWWCNPRTGGAAVIGDFAAQGTITLLPPVDGPDWVLVLDDAAADFDPPGRG
jgi:catechol 2,3-dioxygenase-like lactoylglutathione lyase family enzyme